MDILMVIVSVLIIICVAMQQTKQGLSDALSGESSELFKQQKERGFESVLTRFTFILCTLFLGLGFLIYLQ